MTSPTGDDGGIEVQLAGSFTVRRNGIPVAGTSLGSRKGRLLMKIVTVRRPHVVPLPALVAVLWDHEPPQHAAESVATLVSRLRRQLGAGVVEGGRDGYHLGATVRVDLDAAQRWTEHARARLAADEPGLALVAAARALEVVAGGSALEDEPAAEWAEPARVQVGVLLTRGRLLLADAELRVGEPAAAARTAADAVAADPYDESASRLLMRAWVAAGEPARALSVYADLRDLLARELGADPAVPTRALHLRILGDQAPAPEFGPAGGQRRSGLGVTDRPATDRPAIDRPGPPGTDQPGSDRSAAGLVVGAPDLVGRTEEVRRLRAAWDGGAAGRPALLLLAGEPGNGKTRLAAELERIARATGGIVAPARCYEMERSLFLQPIVDAIGSVVRTQPPAAVGAAVGDDGQLLAGLVPEVLDVVLPAGDRQVPDVAPAAVAPAAGGRTTLEIERRRAFEAVTRFLRRLSTVAPVLLSIDDLQNAGLATVELLHYVARHLAASRVLIVATVRLGEGDAVLEALGDSATRVDVGPLPPVAVARLAAAAGHAELAGPILARTRGHVLFVVETLRGLSAGEPGVPASLQAAVLSRVRRAGPPVEELLRAGAVLGASFDPGTAALVLGRPASAGVARAATALEARLLVAAGSDYEFTNDLVREVLYETTPLPTRSAYHRQAADLLTDRPEAMARHASLAGDPRRAARGWLLAGESALRGLAVADAEELFGAGLRAATAAGDLDVQARALVARSRAREALAAYDGAISDLDAALVVAREVGDRRLEMVVLRALGGQPSIALGRSPTEVTTHLHRGLEIATALGDRAMEADLLAWLAVLSSNGLRFTAAVDQGRRSVTAARASGDLKALAAALDGRKTSLAYLGEVAELIPVLAELEPLLHRFDDQFRLHWALFESAFPAVAAGDWPRATATLERALDANRRSGFSAYESWHVAHLGWLARLVGDYDRALGHGHEALRLTEQTPHAWNAATAAAQLGTTLLETGAVTEAVAILERGRLWAEADGSEAYLLRCLAPLAEATGSPEVLARADAMLAGISTPAGSAWLAGDAAYLAVARGWLARREPERARVVLAPLLAAARRIPWVAPLAAGCLVDGRAAGVLGHRAEARSLLERAADLAGRHRLVAVGADAADALRRL